jgi:GxxExxY protein
MEKEENRIAAAIVDAAIEVHRTLGGPGLLENVYEEALVWELQHRGLKVARQVPLPIRYKGNPLASPLVIDLLVEDLVIIENKATTQYNAIFEVQCLTYLRLSGLKLGLVINFGERWVKDGIHRVVNRL